MSDNAISSFEEKIKVLNIGSYFNNDEEKIRKFKRTLVDYFSRNTELKGLKDYNSVIEAAKQIAQEGMVLGGDVDIIVRGGKARREWNYKGFVSQLSKAGITAKTNVVYSKDTIDIELAEGKVSHKPNLIDRGSILGFYAMIKINGEWIADYMSNSELQTWKSKNLKYNSDAWKNSEAEMAKKTILKRTVKPYIYASNNSSLINTYEEDNATETDDGKVFAGNTVDVPVDSRSPLHKYIEDDVASIEALKSVVDKVKTEAETEAYKTKMIELSSAEEVSQIDPDDIISEAQHKRFWAILNKKCPSKEEKDENIEMIKAKYKISSTKEILKEDYEQLCSYYL